VIGFHSSSEEVFLVVFGLNLEVLVFFRVQISDSLLHDPSSSLEALYFSAQTIRTKVGALQRELRRALRVTMS
jgi:hypothetical protein